MNSPRRVTLGPIAVGLALICVASCSGTSNSDDAGTLSAAPTQPTQSAESSESAETSESVEPTKTVEPAPDADNPPATETGAGTEVVAGSETVCAELQTVQDLADEVTESVGDILIKVGEGASGSEPETLQALAALGNDLEAGLPELLAAYERAAEAALPEVAEEIRAVAEGTSVLTPALADGLRSAAEAGEFIDFEQILSEQTLQAAGQRAGLASLRLDNFTNPVCGFQFSNS